MGFKEKMYRLTCAKTQISLHIRTVRLVFSVQMKKKIFACLAIQNAPREDSDQAANA